MSNVINMGDLRFTRFRPGNGYVKPEECKHWNTTFDANGEIITCDDCHKQVSPLWVLREMLGHYTKQFTKLNSGLSALAEAKAKDISLLAAQRVEKAWRSRTMVPTCPHCHEAIFPQDGFGGSATNKELALRRRQIKAVT